MFIHIFIVFIYEYIFKTREKYIKLEISLYITYLCPPPSSPRFLPALCSHPPASTCLLFIFHLRPSDDCPWVLEPPQPYSRSTWEFIAHPKLLVTSMGVQRHRILASRQTLRCNLCSRVFCRIRLSLGLYQ